MAGDKYSFQYCQKLIVFSNDMTKVLLARRQGEADYDGAWAFIGGKMEVSDLSIIAGLKREKDEEVGERAKMKVYPSATNNVLFHKKDGSTMILPHYLAIYDGGEVRLNKDEYSQADWFAIDDLPNLEPKIENIPESVAWALKLSGHVDKSDFIAI